MGDRFTDTNTSMSKWQGVKDFKENSVTVLRFVTSLFSGPGLI